MRIQFSNHGSFGSRTLQPRPAATNGTCDAFVTKFDLSFSLSAGYSTYLGGTENDAGSGIAVDAIGAAWVTGNTCSQDFPGAVPSIYGDPGPSNPNYPYCTGFVAKIAPDGASTEYSMFLGGVFDGTNYPSGEVTGVALNGSNGVYVSGFATDNLVHTTANAAQRSAPGSSAHGFVGFIDGNGKVEDLTLLTSSGYTVGLTIGVNHQSQVFVGGSN